MDFMKDFLKPEIIWFVVGILLLLMEFAVPGLIIFFFGVGACLVGLLNLVFDLSLNVQLTIFLLSSVFLLVFLRRWLKNIFTGRVKSGGTADPDLEEYIGKRVVVIKKITPAMEGKVEFRGTDWSAEADEVIMKGKPVVIIGKENITLKVKPLED